MSDNTVHPMLELLELTSLNMFLAHSNFQAFTKLKAALQEDGQSVSETDGFDTTFYKPIHTTDDLFQNQAPTLHGMIEAWALAVMQPLVDALNEHTDNSNKISIYFDGDLSNAALYFEDIESYTSNIDADDIEEIKEVLAEWAHSIATIENVAELTDALNNLVTN